MRIAFILESFPNQSETFILSQIVGLLQCGHQVDIYADRKACTLSAHLEIDKYHLLERTYEIGAPKNRVYKFLLGIWLFLIHFWKYPRLCLQTLNIFRYGRWAWSLTLLYSALTIVKRSSSYDVVHGHFGPYGTKALLLKDLGLFQAPVFTSFHGYDVTSIPQRFGKNFYTELFARGDRFLVISNCMKQKLIDLGCPSHKVLVHRVGVDVERFSFIPRSLPANRPVRFISIARLVEKKGIEYAIRAVSVITRTTSRNLEYWIIGDGPLKQDLEQLVSELDLVNCVNFLGFRKQHEIVEYLNQSDILLAPSVSSQNGDQEGIPVVLMEAMARGLPVISTYHSGIPELVENNVSGLLVPEKDNQCLAQRMKYLLDHPEKWPQLGSAGRQKVVTHHNLETLNAQLVQTYFDQIESMTDDTDTVLEHLGAQAKYTLFQRRR